MKTLAELQAIRDKAREKMTVRDNNEEATRVVVGMATCGIAAGARPVLNAFVDEVAKRHLNNVTVTQTGCIGMCQLEPIVEVFVPGKEKGHLRQGVPGKGRPYCGGPSGQRQCGRRIHRRQPDEITGRVKRCIVHIF